MKEDKKYICTDCGGDATVAFTKFRDIKNKKWIIKIGERLCLLCARKRGVIFFNNNTRNSF